MITGRFLRRIFVVFMGTTAALVAIGSGTVCHGKEIRVGMSAAFTGPTRGLGIELYRGSMAYLTHVNENGGVFGRRIEIVAYDDGYNPIPTIRNTIRLVEDDDVLMLFNYVGTPTVTRMLPLLKIYGARRELFLFFPFSGAQPQREGPYAEYVFNLRASYSQEIQGLVDYLLSKGRSRIAVFYQIDAYGRSGWEAVHKSLARKGLRPVGEATYYRGTTYGASMEPQVKAIRASSPDSIISIGAYAACAAFIRDSRDSGLNIPIANVSFVDSENMLKLLLRTGQETGRDYTQNLINSQVVPSHEHTDLPAVAEYRDLIVRYEVMPPKSLIKQDYEPHKYSPVSLEGFLNAKVLVEILQRMGPDFHPKRIKAVVESIGDYDLGISVPVNFGPTRHQGLDEVFLTTVEEGKFVPVGEREKRQE
ncbi:MAG: ABC transporter substrate-binding protein [Desulfomonilaceae bacterium]|nr:ABC transporter substrate-binding protein [Desulfomonilaceae bacterium]